MAGLGGQMEISVEKRRSPMAQDPVRVDPKHYTVELENERV